MSPAPTVTTATQQQELLRWYTRALRIPRLLGKAPGGGRWPGGPYTLTQGVGAGVTAVLGEKTMGIWGHLGVLGNLAVLCGATGVVLLGLRFVRSGGRDPVTATFALLGLMTRPRHGRYAGKAITLAKPHQVTHRLNVLLPPPAAPHGASTPKPAAARHASTPVGATVTAPTAAPAAAVLTPSTRSTPPARPALAPTNLARLLEQAGRTDTERQRVA